MFNKKERVAFDASSVAFSMGMPGFPYRGSSSVLGSCCNLLILTDATFAAWWMIAISGQLSRRVTRDVQALSYDTDVDGDHRNKKTLRMS